MHIKRSKMPKTWPVPRKGTKFVASSSHASKNGIPLLFVLRDLLKIAKTRKEAKHLILNKDVKVNHKIVRDEVFPLQVFDVLNLEKAGKNYVLQIVNRKFVLKEVSGKEAGKKVVKIAGKKVLPGKKIQMNLRDGRNYVFDKDFSVGDSAIIDTEKNNIVKVLPLKEGANLEIILGKHAGEKGKLEEIKDLARGKVYRVKLKEQEVELPFKTILVIE